MTLETRVDALERKDRIRALADRRAQLRADGYTGPHHDPATDRAVSRDLCVLCGGRTLRYLGGMVRLNPWSLVQFIQCKGCGWHSEEL